MSVTSEYVREKIQSALSGQTTTKFSNDQAKEVKKALEAQASTDSRRFGAKAAELRELGAKICGFFADISERDEKERELSEGAPLKKAELAARLIVLLDSLFPVQTGAVAANQADGVQPSPPSSTTQLVLRPGELARVRGFVESMRAAPIVITDAVVADNAAGLQGEHQTQDVSSSWSSLLSAAGVDGSGNNRISEGISFWCPLLEHVRGRYSRGPEALAAECEKQIRIVRAWPRPPNSTTVQKANDLRSVLPVLAQASGTMPSIPLHEDVLRLYVHLLEVEAKRQKDTAANVSLAGEKQVSFGALEVVAPAQPGLDAVSNARFAEATSRKVADDVSDAHVQQCVHVIEQYKVFRSAPKPKPLVPMSVRVVIQQSMAPADARVADAYSIVKGVDDDAERKRTEVKDIMVDIFEAANTVAFERLKRGSAVDRAKRRTLGMQLSAQERQTSLQRESSALAELRVLARCLSVGKSAVVTLRASRSLPELAQDIIRLQPHLSMSQALTLAKSMMKPVPAPPRPKVQISRPGKRPREYDEGSRRIVIQVANGGNGGRSTGGKNKGKGIQVVSALKRRQNKRQDTNGAKLCHWCRSSGHLIADCPARKQGLPRTKRVKFED